MTKHAMLSPSSSDMWLHCPPSARLQTGEHENDPNGYAAEGATAHQLAERAALAIAAGEEPLKGAETEMEQAVDEYAEYVAGVSAQYADDGDKMFFVEHPVNLRGWVSDCYGTADCIIAGNIGDSYDVNIIDFKYGRGVLVSPVWNSQLLMYALGFHDEIIANGYTPARYILHIVQPRANNVRSWTISARLLERWAEDVLLPKGSDAEIGRGEFSAGEWCRWCDHRDVCAERAKSFAPAIGAYQRKDETLTAEEIGRILTVSEGITTWLDGLRERALSMAMDGTVIPGYHVGKGVTRRAWTDEEEVIRIAQKGGCDPFDHRLMSPAQLLKNVDKETAEEVEKYIYTPEGKPRLARDKTKGE